MSSEWGVLRKEDLSLYYYIKDYALRDYIEQDLMVPLYLEESMSSSNSYVYTALTDLIPSPVERGRGWLYFDSGFEVDLCNTATFSGTPEQSNRVVVYETVMSGSIPTYVPISDSEYIIDYIDGRIITSGTCNPTYVSYWWNYVSVVDEWAVVEAAEPPVIVIDMNGTDKTGYQLGGGRKNNRKVDIYLFASSTAERNDLSEKIYDALYLKSCPLYVFPKGTVLDSDGTFYDRKYNMNKLTSLFSRDTIEGISNLQFENVSARHVNLPLVMTRNRNEIMLSDLNAYRSKISFDLISYTDT